MIDDGVQARRVGGCGDLRFRFRQRASGVDVDHVLQGPTSLGQAIARVGMFEQKILLLLEFG